MHTMASNWETVSDLVSEDIIDSQDMIEKIEELEEIDQAAKDAREEGEEPTEELDEDQRDLLKALKEFEDAGAEDWKFGETFIRESYFQKHAEQVADELGAIPGGLAWPCTCIDWDRAARELQMDYSSVKVGGVTYHFR